MQNQLSISFNGSYFYIFLQFMRWFRKLSELQDIIFTLATLIGYHNLIFYQLVHL